MRRKGTAAILVAAVIGTISYPCGVYAENIASDTESMTVSETETYYETEAIKELETEAIEETAAAEEVAPIEIQEEQNKRTTLDNVEQFVARFYRYILNRAADGSGLEAWTNNLKSGKEQGAQVGVGFIQSNEFKSRGLSNEDYIKVLYRAFFDREADGAGLESWKKALDSGLTRMQVYRGFAESDEFSQLCKAYGIERGFVSMTAPMDQNEGVTKFIARCYNLCLGRSADESGLNAWCGQILSGANSAKQAAYGFVFSDEFKKMNLSDDEYIRVLYRLFLDREADASGLNAWKNELLSGKSRLHIFEGFSDSKEFIELCAKYGINSGKDNPIMKDTAAFKAKMLDIYKNPVDYFVPGDRDNPQVENNHFAIADVTGDGYDDLIVTFDMTFTAVMHTKVFSYSQAQNTVYEVGILSATCDYYTGGLVTEYANHNQTFGELWPGFVAKFDGTSFKSVASFYSWNRLMNSKGFPSYADKDGDGIVYYFGADENLEPMDYAEYESKRSAVYQGHELLSIPWKNITLSNINAID